MEKPNVLYHFTSLETLISIIEKKELWMFDITKSNDPYEGKFVIESIKEAFSSLRREEGKDYSYDDYYRLFFDWYESSMDNSSRQSALIVSLSFCDPQNELLLWRSYSNNGNGIAIGFDKTKLMNMNNKQGFSFGKIEYKTMKEMEKQSITFLKNTKEYDEEKKIEALDRYYHDGLFIKQKSYRGECEYRLLKQIADFRDYTLLYPKEKIDNIGYFVRNNDLTVYYKLPINGEDERTLGIYNIVVGPTCETSSKEIKLLLAQNGFPPMTILYNTWLKMR